MRRMKFEDARSLNEVTGAILESRRRGNSGGTNREIFDRPGDTQLGFSKLRWKTKNDFPSESEKPSWSCGRRPIFQANLRNQVGLAINRQNSTNLFYYTSRIDVTGLVFTDFVLPNLFCEKT